MADTPVTENPDSGFEEYVTKNKISGQSINSNKVSSISSDDLKIIIAKVEDDNEISDDSQNSALRSRVDLCMQGLEDQKVKKYPFTVVKNPKSKKLLHTSLTGEYRQYIEYSTVAVLYKHPSEFTMVEVVKDAMTGFKHICKTIIISKFRREELDAMAVMQDIAPELFGICREGENVRLHMEYIQGVRLDYLSKILLDQHAWPVCLHLFGELAKAINKLGVEHLSHCDIHVKNVILEVDSDNSLRIRLIDYGDASTYSLSGLMNDMKSLVACIITVFTENEFDSYEEDPAHWISTCQALYPQLYAMLKGALMVHDTRHLTKLIEDLDHIIKNQIDYKRNLKEAASTMQETTKPKHITLEEDLRNLRISSDKGIATDMSLPNGVDTYHAITFQEDETLHDMEV
ncbi:unnamed protein product [Mytilus coruscus]|uniref:Protein kinase domain-containing protein n=1 Tax=Mytilus coruscus TaxID=42192 RepID=A0A6J8AIW8_MYTCO|nr:unnamed protein product [Mytilus coruscus]